jgi:hypothetical protein
MLPIPAGHQSASLPVFRIYLSQRYVTPRKLILPIGAGNGDPDAVDV